MGVKDCACCEGVVEGNFEQWWNQDIDYSCCKACIEWMIDDHRETLYSIDNLYGKAGVHRPVTRFDE